MPFDREAMKGQLARIADQGVFIGTSSWKYEGWLGQLYTPSRYEYHGKLAKSRFERDCLAEYAETFKTVCVDAAYYTFPTEKYLTGLVSQVPSDFRFGLKVTDAITIKTFTNLPRHGAMAGQTNPDFLNADLFAQKFLTPLEPFRSSVGVLMFEFSRFHSRHFCRGREFVEALDQFLSKIPEGWPYGIEMRNQNWLGPDYFACLTNHKVTHVLNSWSQMPPVSEQLAMPGSVTNEHLIAARFLLKPGRTYEQSVSAFAPYKEVKDPDPSAREAGRKLIHDGRATPSRKTFLFVNNRLEGNALSTISAFLSQSDRTPLRGGRNPREQIENRSVAAILQAVEASATSGQPVMLRDCATRGVEVDANLKIVTFCFFQESGFPDPPGTPTKIPRTSETASYREEVASTENEAHIRQLVVRFRLDLGR